MRGREGDKWGKEEIEKKRSKKRLIKEREITIVVKCLKAIARATRNKRMVIKLLRMSSVISV